MKNKHEIDMTEGSLLPKLIMFILPLMLTNVLQVGFNMADLIVIGQFSGETSLAAVGSNSSIITLIVCVLNGISIGTNVLVSRYFGAKDQNNLQKTVSTSILVAFFGGIAVGIVGFFVAPVLLELMGTPEDVLPLAVQYLRIYFTGLPVIVMYNFGSAIMRAVGDTKRPLYFLTTAGILNVIMNLIFVIYFRLDVAGVALATVLSQCVSCFLVIRCLVKAENPMYRLDIKHLKFSKPTFSALIRIGLPAGIQGSMFSISNIIIQSSINSFGAVVMAGNSAAASIESIVFVAQDAVSQAAIAAVSQNLGAADYPRTKKTVRACTIIEVIICLTLGFSMYIFAKPLLSIYTNNPEAISNGSIRMFVLGTTYVANGLMNMMTGCLRGYGYTVLPVVLTLSGVCVLRIIWIFTVFIINRSLFILYLSYPITWTITAILEYIVYFRGRKKMFLKANPNSTIE
jgi:putative MATE family efflux protein